MRTSRILATAAAVPVMLAGAIGTAHADTLQDTIADDGTGVSLVAGSTVSGSAGIRLIGNSAQGDPDQTCNIDAGEDPLKLDIVTPAGVTANPDPLDITSCGDNFTVSFTASSTAVSGEATVTVVSGPAGGGTYVNNVHIPITVTHPDSTAPVITPDISGTLGNNGWYTSNVTLSWTVTDPESTVSSTSGCDTVNITADQAATTYTCSATSAGGSSSSPVTIKRDATAPVVLGADVNNQTWRNISLSQGFTASDAGSGLADPSDASFTLTASDESSDPNTPTTDSKTVVDNAGNSTTRSLSALIDLTDPVVNPASVNNTTWRNTSLSQTFTASDPLSGLADGSDASFMLTASAQSANASTPTTVSNTVYDNAGNSTTRSVSALIDLTKPSVSLAGGPSGTYYFGDTIPTPTCNASDALSGLAGCMVTGGGGSVGWHSFTATATDNAGNVETDTISYEVLTWSLRGFYAPVDMSGVWNTVKGGSTVPLKFEAFAANELTSTGAVKSFTQKIVACPGGSATTDEIEIVTTGGTALRYDSTAGQFVQNWQTPKKPGTCYTVTMTTQDGSMVAANFMLK
jgi:hypothetical protein